MFCWSDVDFLAGLPPKKLWMDFDERLRMRTAQGLNASEGRSDWSIFGGDLDSSMGCGSFS